VARDGKLTLTIHGLEAFHGDVDGEVFAEKFSAFIHGLAAADKAANGERRHKFVISDLVKNTATATVSERGYKSGVFSRSGIAFYEAGLDEIRLDTPAARLLPLELVQSVATLNRGVHKKFEFGEIKGEGANVIRIDSFLASQAERVLADIKRKDPVQLTFAGTAYGSFDGIMKAVDFQPAMKRGVLWLSAGGMPIQCNITNVALEDVRAAVESRCVVYGLAHYDGKSGLPKLLDIHKVEVIASAGSISQWRGAFEFDDSDVESWGDL
jgi:hypothetical protein